MEMGEEREDGEDEEEESITDSPLFTSQAI